VLGHSGKQSQLGQAHKELDAALCHTNREKIENQKTLIQFTEHVADLEKKLREEGKKVQNLELEMDAIRRYVKEMEAHLCENMAYLQEAEEHMNKYITETKLQKFRKWWEMTTFRLVMGNRQSAMLSDLVSLTKDNKVAAQMVHREENLLSELQDKSHNAELHMRKKYEDLLQTMQDHHKDLYNQVTSTKAELDEARAQIYDLESKLEKCEQSNAEMNSDNVQLRDMLEETGADLRSAQVDCKRWCERYEKKEYEAENMGSLAYWLLARMLDLETTFGALLTPWSNQEINLLSKCWAVVRTKGTLPANTVEGLGLGEGCKAATQGSRPEEWAAEQRRQNSQQPHVNVPGMRSGMPLLIGIPPASAATPSVDDTGRAERKHATGGSPGRLRTPDPPTTGIPARVTQTIKVPTWRSMIADAARHTINSPKRDVKGHLIGQESWIGEACGTSYPRMRGTRGSPIRRCSPASRGSPFSRDSAGSPCLSDEDSGSLKVTELQISPTRLRPFRTPVVNIGNSMPKPAIVPPPVSADAGCMGRAGGGGLFPLSTYPVFGGLGPPPAPHSPPVPELVDAAPSCTSGNSPPLTR
ncbi:hypothetical protein CYMTET_12584, partial [Cymbomonas tetramitiformis]